MGFNMTKLLNSDEMDLAQLDSLIEVFFLEGEDEAENLLT